MDCKELNKASEIVERKVWTIDGEIPIFSQDTNYINRFLK